MQFLTPFAFALSALAVPIILLYMLKLRRKQTQVSSTMLWEKLLREKQANAPWQKLKRNLLLFLQLLILAASEQDEQLRDGNELGKDDRDRHKDDQVPGLIGRQQFHVVGHCCFHMYVFLQV